MSRFFVFFTVYLTYCTTSGFMYKRSADVSHDDYFELSIIHINDIHARFVQTSTASSSCRKGKEQECVGGLARVSTVSRQILKKRPNAIFLNAGDNYQGTMWYNLFKWNVTAYFMNKMPFDAMTLGNHEFDDGIDGIVPFLQSVNTPVVVSNIDANEEPTIQGLYKNSTIIVRGNRKIGIIGVITQTTIISSKPGNLKFFDEIESVNQEAERLKSKGIDIIIVLSHVGLDVDRIIAEKCPEVDVIVGGHSHSFLFYGKPPFPDNPEDEYPVVVKQNVGNRTVLIVQALAFTKYLGHLTVWFDREGEVIGCEGNPIFLDSSIEEDPKILEELKPWAKAVEAAGNKIVGETRSFLNGTCRVGECNMANVITDSMTYAYKKIAKPLEEPTYPAFGCINGGGIRANIPAGPITFSELAEVLPFENRWNFIELQGGDLRNALEESVSHDLSKNRFEDPAFLHCSGIKVVYNMSMPAWSRIQSLNVRCQDCKEPIYEPLNRDKWYHIVVSSYIIGGGDGLRIMADKHRNVKLGPVDVHAFQDYVQSISPFDYEIEGRVRFIR